MSSIELKSITKSFHDHIALKDVSLRIEAGQIGVVVGPSGSGKSTLLRVIAGLEKTNSGELYLDNQIATTATPLQRRVGMLFQYDSLYPHLTVSENIHFAKSREDSDVSWQSHFEELIHWMEIESLLQRKPQQLSGGEQQRVALARALIRRPRILLLDEPLSHLDRRLSQLVQHKILEAQKKYGMTMLYVTHDLEQAIMFANRLIVLNEGTIVQSGTPAEILENAHPFVRDFLDLESQFRCEGRGIERNTQYFLRFEDVEIPLMKSKQSDDTFSTARKEPKDSLPAARISCRIRLLEWRNERRE